MDVLDPAEVTGHSLAVADGPTSHELAAALTEMFKYEKTAAIGIASTPYGENDRGGLSRQAAYRLIQAAVAKAAATPAAAVAAAFHSHLFQDSRYRRPGCSPFRRRYHYPVPYPGFWL